MHGARPRPVVEQITTYGLALTLCLIGIGVLIVWHSPHGLARIYPYATLMAYNTAIGFCACGIGLYAIFVQQRALKSIACLMLLALGLSTLLDLLTNIPLDTTNWFVVFLTAPPSHNQPIPPTASLAFILAACAIYLGFNRQGTSTVIACLLGIVILFLTLIAMLSQGFGIYPEFVWLGIKMAPHTAAGLTLFAIGLINLRLPAAIAAFNRFNIFTRLATGYALMSLLFIGVGSVGALQINSVASITQEFYENPIQLNNAVQRIKQQLVKLNRELKDIAVNPDLVNEINIPDSLRNIEFDVIQELDIIQKKSDGEHIAELNHTFHQWQAAILASYEKLLAGNIEAYRSQTLNETQHLTVKLEYLCESLIQQSQQRILELNEKVIETREHAGNLMLAFICGFLLVGLAVAAIITRSLNSQMQHIRHTMERLAQGDTSVPIPFLDHPYEVGVMAKTLAVFAENMEARKQYAALLVQHQQELEASNQRLAKTNKELETFAYVASHDLKSPLRGIAQLSTWIEEDISTQEYAEVDKHTAMLRNRIHRMERLLDDLLIFYRAGKANGKRQRINTRDLVVELFDIQNTKPGLHLELGDDLPEFETLSTPFEQVLRNFLSNAIKHHDKNEGVIRFDCRSLDSFYEFSVSDDGPGIPAKFHERIFGMFQTLKPRDELEGSGMGLALIKKLVEAYGGNVKIYSEGRGSRFTFTWPKTIREQQDHDR